MKPNRLPLIQDLDSQNFLPLELVLESYFRNQDKQIIEQQFLKNLIDLTYIGNKTIISLISILKELTPPIKLEEIWIDLQNQQHLEIYFLFEKEPLRLFLNTELNLKIEKELSKLLHEPLKISLKFQPIKPFKNLPNNFTKLNNLWHTQAFI